MDYLESSLSSAGCDHLMTEGVKETLVAHASGNLRLLNNMALELLGHEAHEELSQLDEKLFLKTFSHAATSVKKRPKR